MNNNKKDTTNELLHNKKIGRTIRNYREINGVSILKLAEVIGRTRQYISNVENGKSSCNSYDLQLIIDFLKIPPEEIYVIQEKSETKSRALKNNFKLLQLKVEFAKRILSCQSIDDLKKTIYKVLSYLDKLGENKQ